VGFAVRIRHRLASGAEFGAMSQRARLRTMLRRAFDAPPLARLLGVGSIGLAWLGLAAVVTAHSGSPPPPPVFPSVLFLWSFDPTVVLPLVLAATGYVWAVRSVDAAHPLTRVPRGRIVAWLAGLIVIELALQSPIEAYDTTLFSDHMVQHVLLTIVAAPLLALGAPITLLLRFAQPEVRRRWILPILHSRIMKVISFPVVTWILFAGYMWLAHFTALYELSLENPLIHQAEHAGFLVTALLFWWPAVAADPSPWRMGHPSRLVYTFLQMPQNTFLGLTIYSATVPLYPYYVNLARTWGPSVLADQQMAGGIMWISGDVVFMAAIMLILRGLLKKEEREAAANDARVAPELAAIREREARLAERLASERRGGSQTG
jgi:cytochrome c oxidase assembly factor CtaG